MNPQTDSYLMAAQGEIGQWEHAINCYTGSDPLDLWFRYICWIETNSKSAQGLEEKFRKAVEQCLSLYDKYENYKQDLRMVKLWIKYIDFQPNKPNLYKILYQQGIGTKCAAFYIAWAHYYCYYNSENSLKQAESIYNLGVQLKAEPLHELESAQKNFRYSVAQRMLYNDESSKKRTISSLAEQRQQITSLSPHPNASPSQPSLKRARTESSSSEYGQQSEMSSTSGYSSPYNSQNGSTSSGYSQQAQVMNPQTTVSVSQPQPQYSNHQNYYQQPPSETGYAMSTSMNMTNQYVYDESLNTYSAPPTVQQEPIVYTFDCGFQRPPNFVNYSRNSQEPWDGLLFLEEPYDPNRRCFYPKNQVYPGDGCEYSLEELMAVKWRIKMEEKRKREEQEKIRLEQERQRQEAERIRQEQEARRLREEHEAMRIKMEQQKVEAERIRKQHEEEQRRYQMYQQQQHQQQWNAYHSPVSYSSPAPHHYQHSPYENSPQYYSYAHDHQYQTNYQPQPTFQHSPHNFQNSPSYHQIPPSNSSVIVNRNQYENPQQHNYFHSYAPHQQTPYVQPVPPQQGYVENNYQYSQQTMPMQAQIKYPEQNIVPPQNSQPKTNFEEPDYQDVEYLIDHQAEIDPRMLKQPILDGAEFEGEGANGSDSESSDSEESDEEQIPTIVNSYMLDDLEEQIEASTISFSSNGKSRDKKITIKFRKEKTIIANSESNSSSSHQRYKVPLEPSSTSSSSQSSSKKKKTKKTGELLTSFDSENTQFMPSATNSNSSIQGDQNFSKLSFNGCVTPVRKQAASKTSTPVSSYKFLKNKSSFLSHNDESFTGDQNSFFQAENDDEFKTKRLDKALATIDEHFEKKDIDPFNSELCRAFLTKIDFPSRKNAEGYKVISMNLPKFAKNQTVHLGGISYHLEKEVGRGSYGYVYRGVNLNDGSVVALKYQRASNLSTWELYICTEVRKRIKNADILPGFMTISAAVIAPNASVLISEFSQYGSLLDINNKIRIATTKVMHESLAMHFASQILNIVAYLHDCKIVHADIKPDNFLLMSLPSADDHIPSLRLIDFGCAIDMTFFKEGQEFKKIIETDGFTCVEMQEGRLWSYQTDLFCIAATIHVMLFSEYMQAIKNFGQWEIKQKFPRYLNKTLWTDVFSKLLNIKDSNNLPNLRHMKAKIDRDINDNELVKHIRTLNNLIRKR